MRIPTIKAYKFLSKGMFQATKEMKASFVNKPRQAALSKELKLGVLNLNIEIHQNLLLYLAQKNVCII